MPKTAFTNFSKQDNQVLKHIGEAPVVVKLLEGTQGLGVVLAETNKAAKSVVEAFDSLKTRVILQEYIKEAGGADIRVFIVNGQIVGAMKRQGKEGEFRSNLHRGGKATVINLTRAEKATALKAAKAMGLAIAGVDMLQSDRGPMVLEVNSSPGLEGIEKSTGVDVAAKIIEYVEESVSKKRRPKDRVKA
jgi:ribosomal protein S6--L-glutamate ligase